MPIARKEHGVVVMSDRGEKTVGRWHVRTATAERPTEHCSTLCGIPIGSEVREVGDERPELPLFDEGEPAEEFDERNVRAAEDRASLTRCECRTDPIGAWGRSAAKEINEDARVEEREVHTSPLPIPTAHLA